jgi:hypothetical protein
MVSEVKRELRRYQLRQRFRSGVQAIVGVNRFHGAVLQHHAQHGQHLATGTKAIEKERDSTTGGPGDGGEVGSKLDKHLSGKVKHLLHHLRDLVLHT